IEGNGMYAGEQILEHVSFHEGDNLFSFDLEKAEAELRKNLPYIGDVEISRKLPSTVLISVSERTEDMALHLGDEIYLVSGDLQVLARFDANEVVPNITTLYTGPVSRCIVGEELTFLENRTGTNLKELYTCLIDNKIQKKVKSIDITSRFDITLNYDGRFTVYLASTENIDIKIRFLVAILERLGSGEKGYINLADHREAAVRLDD
ncbi:MAG: FtsQ-type POTRA domain-containing protein, partial [Clostridia bacterium]|nr:FtsQ-type POTRA domain-containing protein [Clostridia bacterium]